MSILLDFVDSFLLVGPIGYQDAPTHENLVEMADFFWEWVVLKAA